MSTQTPPPLIGVSGCRKLVDGQDFDAAGHKYVSAVVHGCAAVPLVIPTLGDALDRKTLLERIDGILFTGSLSNVEPHRYKGPASADGTLHDPHRDATTLPLIREAVAAGVPVFCICRGFQELNVAFGGSLHQRVHELPGKIDHREPPDRPMEIRYGPAHSLDLREGGLLAELAGGLAAEVNSLHEQGIDRLADALTVEATAPDGLIEGVRVEDAGGFAVGVQWHPEWKVTDNPFYLALFEAFAVACRAQASERK